MNDMMLTASAKINANGRIVLPAAMREAIGVKAGDEVLLRVEDGDIRVYTLANAIRQIQARSRQYTKGRTGLVDEFIRQRRAEARKEAREWAAQGRARKAHS